MISIDWLAWDSDGTAGVTTSDTNKIQHYDLYWSTDFYSYATGADCRGAAASDFTKNGGVVYTLAIDYGNLERTDGSPDRYYGPTKGYCGYYFVDYQQTGWRPGTGIKLRTFEPSSGPDSTSGTTNTCEFLSLLSLPWEDIPKTPADSVQFEQDMQMWNDDGQHQYTFTASYSDSWSLDKFLLHATRKSHGVDFSVDYKDLYVRPSQNSS